MQTLLTVIPVLTAGLYLLGLTYHQGYLAAFRIDDSAFPLANDRALFNGLISLFSFTFPGIIYAAGALVAFAALVIVVLILSSTERYKAARTWAKSWVARLRRDPSSTSPIANDLIDKSATLYGYLAWLFVLLFLLLLMAALSAKGGRDQAEREIADFLAGKATRAQLFSPELQTPFAGKLVMCGDKYCALWGGTETIIMGHDRIQKIVTTKPTPLGKSASSP